MSRPQPATDIRDNQVIKHDRSYFHLSRSRLLAHSLLEQVEVSNYGRAPAAASGWAWSWTPRPAVPRRGRAARRC